MAFAPSGIGRRNSTLALMALAGWLLVTAGGVFKATWKLITWRFVLLPTHGRAGVPV